MDISKRRFLHTYMFCIIPIIMVKTNIIPVWMNEQRDNNFDYVKHMNVCFTTVKLESLTLG